MSKVKELVFMVSDLVKLISDDTVINEDHIIYLLDVYRAFLLKQRYEKDPKRQIPESNYQVLCFGMQQYEYKTTVDVCSTNQCSIDKKNILKSTTTVPPIMSLGIPKLYSVDEPFNYTFTRVPASRFEFVGNNKWLQNFVYWCIGPDGYIYMKSSNPCYLSKTREVHLSAIFENCRETMDTVKYIAAIHGNIYDCNTLENDFPIEESLIPNLIELTVKDVLGASYRPKDNTNNANDDLSDIAAFVRQNMKDRYVKDTQEA